MRTINSRKLTFSIFVTLALLIPAPVVFALPPDPDNAALLYYQVFLTYEKPDDTMKDMLADLASGKIEPNTRITEFIKSQKAVIKLAVTAAELPNCHWGLKYSEGLSMEMPYLSRTKHLAWLILADARTIAANGDYELAIDRCLTARKFAIQIAYEPTAISFLLAIAIERRANECIQDILSSLAVELQILQHLKAKLDKLDSISKPLEFFLKTEQEVMAMYTTPDRIRELLPYVDPECTPRLINASEDTRNYILNADEQFCQRNLTYYNKHWNAVFSALELPYQQAYNKLTELDKKAAEDYKENPDAFIAMLLAPAVWKIYNNGVQSTTFSNALKTAIEIYMITARTGQLPDSPPAGLPKDLFSDKDFEYERKDNGFVLRCQGKDLVKDETHEYEFKVKK